MIDRAHQKLARVVARMHFDPLFCREVFEGPCPPDLSSDQHQQILALDRRAFGCDPHRSVRLVQALFEEAPVSSALAGLQHLTTFCQSQVFHRAVMERARMIEVYLEWLAPQAGAMAALELTIAKARRRTPPAPKPDQIILSPQCGVLVTKAHTLEHYQKARSRLGDDPLAWLTKHGKLADFGAPTTQDKEAIIVAHGSLSRCNEAMAQLLLATQEPTSLQALWRQFGQGDLSKQEFAQVIQDLADDDLVRGHPRD